MLTKEHLPHYVYNDYVLWEGDWELIEGIPYAMTPSPVYRHQKLSHKITVLLDEALSQCESCEALFALDWKITDDTVVQPDNLVVCYKPKEAFLTRAPALIFEILSPATAQKDRNTKYALYEREGVAYYCIVDPENKVIKIYSLIGGRYIKKLDALDESVDFDLGKCSINLDFSKIWLD